MAEATWEEDPPLLHTKEELIRALFRANALLTGEWGYGKLAEVNGLAAQHARFMLDGEEYEDFQQVQQKIDMEEEISG